MPPPGRERARLPGYGAPPGGWVRAFPEGMSTRTQAPRPGERDPGPMLWSDDQPDERDDDLRRTQLMVRRAMIVVALGAAVVMLLTAWRA